MIELTGKQKSKLRSLAMTRPAAFQVGKEGLTPTLLSAIDDFVRKNELVKIALLDTAASDFDEVALALSERQIAVVQKIGHTFVGYRPNPKLEKRIELPR
ncbi:MAG: YhbY family RNA-binding protein [Candidatus Izemoplasmatales bacterium]